MSRFEPNQAQYRSHTHCQGQMKVLLCFNWLTASKVTLVLDVPCLCCDVVNVTAVAVAGQFKANQAQYSSKRYIEV